MLDAPRDRGEQPALKVCRALGRIGGLRRHVPDAVPVVVMRDPFSRFASSRRQYVQHGNDYFLAEPLLLLATHRTLPMIELRVRYLEVPLPDLADALTGLAACEAILGANTPDAWYRCFLAFWAMTAAIIPDDVDLVIDSDAMARTVSYRLYCEFELAALTARMINLGGPDGTGEAAGRGESGDVGEAGGLCERTGMGAPPLRRSELLRAQAQAEAFFGGRHRMGRYPCSRSRRQQTCRGPVPRTGPHHRASAALSLLAGRRPGCRPGATVRHGARRLGGADSGRHTAITLVARNRAIPLAPPFFALTASRRPGQQRVSGSNTPELDPAWPQSPLAKKPRPGRCSARRSRTAPVRFPAIRHRARASCSSKPKARLTPRH